MNSPKEHAIKAFSAYVERGRKALDCLAKIIDAGNRNIGTDAMLEAAENLERILDLRKASFLNYQAVEYIVTHEKKLLFSESERVELNKLAEEATRINLDIEVQMNDFVLKLREHMIQVSNARRRIERFHSGKVINSFEREV